MTTLVREYDNRDKDALLTCKDAEIVALRAEVKRLTGELQARERLSEAYRISGELRELLTKENHVNGTC